MDIEVTVEEAMAYYREKHGPEWQYYDDLYKARFVWGRNLPEEKEKPAPRLYRAKYPGHCKVCCGGISRGDLITRARGQWVHEHCK